MTYPPQHPMPPAGHGHGYPPPRGYPGQQPQWIAPQQGYPPAQGWGGPPQPPQKPKRGKGPLFAVLGCFGVLLLLAGTIVGVYFVNTASEAGGKDSEIFTADSGFKPGAQITPASLAATDSESIFWTMYRNQMRKPVLQMNNLLYQSRKKFEEKPRDAFAGLMQSRIDYRSQQLTVGSTSYWDPHGVVEMDGQRRCVGDKNFNDRDHGTRWEEDRMDYLSCTTTGMKVHSGDGVAPGGLTDAQADQYIEYLQTYYGKNPISVGKPELASHAGKQYIRLPVKVTPVETSYGYSGMMVFMWGMQHIGLHPIDHLWSDFGAGGSGAEIVYFIDPATTLPAYRTIEETPSLDKDGKPETSDSSMSFERTQYSFPDQWRPYDLNNPEDLKPFTIDWEPTVP